MSRVTLHARLALTSSQGFAAAVGCCVQCHHWIRSVQNQGPHRGRYVIANLYADNGHRRWLRCELYHPECYVDIGEPHGPTPPYRKRMLLKTLVK